MASIPESLINEVRAKTDIVDTISRYMTLTKKGKNYLGVCPFHDDHDPSMSVSIDRQIYKCFVCGAGGNVFSFVQNIENISFIEAVLKVAEGSNVDMSHYQTLGVKPIDPRHALIYKALAEAQQFMAFQLFTQDGQEALAKLEKRGYSHELIQKFGIGVAFGNNQILNFLKAKGFSEDILVEADLIRIRDDGSFSDVFYNRIVFPIFNAATQVIGFSARALSDSNNVKYINTGETPVYVKGNAVYNIQNAKDVARKENLIIITEGVTDAIAFSKVGYDNVVSLLGVAGTPEQIRMIRQSSAIVMLAFDGDHAGLKATYAIGLKLVKARCSVYVWYNDSGLDPDDYVREKGKKGVEEGINHRLNWLDFVLNYAYAQYGLDNFDKRKRVVEFVLDHLQDHDALTQNHYLKVLENKTGFDMNALSHQMAIKTAHYDQKPKIHTAQAPRIHPVSVSIPERAVLKQMLGSKEAAYHFRDHLGFLPSSKANDLALVILDCYRQHDVLEFADVLSRDIHEDLKQLALDIDTGDVIGEFDLQSLDENIQLIQRELSRIGISHLSQEGRQSYQLEEQVKLLNKAIQQQRNRNK